MICLSSSPVSAIMSDRTEPRNEPKMIPVRMIVSIFIERSTSLAKPMTRNIVIAAPVILKTGNVYVPKIGIDKPKKSVTTAPTEAPDDTPSVYGSASGFFSNPWKAAPEMASAAPTSPAKYDAGHPDFP